MNQEASKPRKVLYVITKAGWGGAQRYVFDLVCALPKERYTPTVAFGVPGVLSAKLAEKNIATVTIPSLGRDIALLRDLKSFFQIFSAISKTKPDIVHLNSSKAAALGAFAAWICQVPEIVFTVHGWPHKEKRGSLSRTILYLISWLTALFSDVVIVVSKDDEKRGKNMPLVGNKIHYVPIGINAPVYLSEEGAHDVLAKTIPSHKLSRDFQKIVTIAELTANKGIDVALKAMFNLSTHSQQAFIYVVIGEGEQRAALERLVKENHVEDKVYFLGFVENASALLLAFDIFLLPSIKEGMPYVLLEAGESGIPTIATDAVNLELKERYPNIRIVKAGNSLAIADAVNTIGTVSHMRSSEPHAAKFPLEEMVKNTTALYI